MTEPATHCPDTLQPAATERGAKSARAVTDRTRILVIEDDGPSIDWMSELLEDKGYAIKAARDGRTAEAIRDAWQPHLVLMDLRLPDTDGTKLLTRFRDAAPQTEIVIITGYGSVSTAVDAMKQGAFSFIEKPVGPEVLLAVIEKALERSAMSEENRRLRERLKKPTGFANIVAASDRMHELFHVMRLAAPTDANILIHGESGTGKELVASAIHLHSKRANGPFISINCAAVPAELIESELFGHRKGAFTGAMSDKVGLVELAEKGTLFLDEIGEMPSALQVKLLRLLQEREFRPVGGTREIRADFRLICATNAVLDGPNRKVREDLFFRVNTITLEVPPLRERIDDLPLLCSYFIDKFGAQHKRSIQGIEPAAQRLLTHYAWPGNIRELEHVIERAMIVASGKEIAIVDLPEALRKNEAVAAAAAAAVSAAPPAEGLMFGQLTLAEIEKNAIIQTLKRTNGNKCAAATILGVYRPTLYSKLRKYKLDEYLTASKDGDDVEIEGEIEAAEVEA